MISAHTNIKTNQKFQEAVVFLISSTLYTTYFVGKNSYHNPLHNLISWSTPEKQGSNLQHEVREQSLIWALVLLPPSCWGSKKPIHVFMYLMAGKMYLLPWSLVKNVGLHTALVYPSPFLFVYPSPDTGINSSWRIGTTFSLVFCFSPTHSFPRSPKLDPLVFLSLGSHLAHFCTIQCLKQKWVGLVMNLIFGLWYCSPAYNLCPIYWGKVR